MWRKWNTCALLVDIEIGVATMENSMVFPQKLKVELPHGPAIKCLGMVFIQRK